MFTGIIKDIGTITNIEQQDKDKRFTIQTGINLQTVELGASIACSGVCLTVVAKQEYHFEVDVSSETLSKSNFYLKNIKDRVNIEPSLKLGDEMGGHIVTGHVDCVAEIEAIEMVGDSHRFSISLPKGFQKYIAPKGSITVDGISLTVNEVFDNKFQVHIIPHTYRHTCFQFYTKKTKVNLEIDIISRYIANYLDKK